MTTLSEDSLRFFFFASAVLCIMGIYSTVQRVHLRARPGAILRSAALLVPDLLWISILYDLCRHAYHGDPLRSALSETVAALPLWLSAAILVCLTALGIIVIVVTEYIKMRTITMVSVSEGLSVLPTGVAMAGPDGAIMNANRTMVDLCRAATGELLNDADVFWRHLTRGKVLDGVRVTPGDAPVAELPDGGVWLFERRELTSEVGPVTQLTAVEAAELHRLNMRLQEENAAIEDYNARLRRYGEMVDDTVKREELLAMRTRVHDRMGEALLAAKMFLTSPDSPVTRDQLLRQWRTDIRLLLQEASGEQHTEQLQRLRDAAGFLGLELTVFGQLPEDEAAMELICAGIQECMTNAVKHAGATALYVSVIPAARGWKVSLFNNGADPEEPVREGGGMSLLRGAAEQLGARLELRYEPRFTIVLHIPAGMRKEGFHFD